MIGVATSRGPTRERDRPAAANDGARKSNRATGSVTSVAEATDHIAHRLLQEIVASAWAPQRRRRAQEFLDARHRPGIDFPGRQRTPEQHRANNALLTEVAEALLNSAELAPLDEIAADVANVLGEAV